VREIFQVRRPDFDLARATVGLPNNPGQSFGELPVGFSGAELAIGRGGQRPVELVPVVEVPFLRGGGFDLVGSVRIRPADRDIHVVVTAQVLFSTRLVFTYCPSDVVYFEGQLRWVAIRRNRRAATKGE
jgi:hypothetical protein